MVSSLSHLSFRHACFTPQFRSPNETQDFLGGHMRRHAKDCLDPLHGTLHGTE